MGALSDFVSGLDFGNVPEWISSVSVPAALYIIWRDKKKEGLAQANLVVCWAETHDAGVDEQGRHFEVVVHVHNTSSAPIRRISAKLLHKAAAGESLGSNYDLIELSTDSPGGRRVDGREMVPVLQADEEVEFEGRYTTSAGVKSLNFYEADVFFLDSTGRHFGRDLTDYKLYPHGRNRYGGGALH